MLIGTSGVYVVQDFIDSKFVVSTTPLCRSRSLALVTKVSAYRKIQMTFK